jgi:prevent-host-death family protein
MDHLVVYLMELNLMMVHGGAGMQLSVTEAKGRLTDLVRRAEAGDEVILTRHGHAVVRLVPVKAVPGRRPHRTLLEAARASGAAKAKAGPKTATEPGFPVRR